MIALPRSRSSIEKLLKDGTELPLATKNYPSRGQTAVQELYQTKIGKLFRKKVSDRNHIDCQVNPKAGTLAEREHWAFCLAESIGLYVPPLRLIDNRTTVQQWLDLPDAHLYKMSQGKMDFEAQNVFDCALYDWLTGQIDRHDANYLYDYIHRKIIPVDSAHGFLKYEGSLPDYLHLYEIGNEGELHKRYATQTKAAIKVLSDQSLKKLVPLRDQVEFQALLRRRDDLNKVNTIQDILNLYRGMKR